MRRNAGVRVSAVFIVAHRDKRQIIYIFVAAFVLVFLNRLLNQLGGEIGTDYAERPYYRSVFAL